MENVIAGLLRNFEAGKMDRRRLIQSLSMRATNTLQHRIALITLALALAVALVTAQQPAGRGGQNPFPGGTNPDGSLRPTRPVTSLFSQDAYTEYSLLEP